MSISRRSLVGTVRQALQPFAPTSAPTEQAVTVPPIEVIAMNRMAYGPRNGDLERVRNMGLEAYVDEQLSPNDADDALLTAKLATATYHIEYGSGAGAVNEDRTFKTLGQNIAQLWPLREHNQFAERIRPADEVRAATWLRMVYSKWQLREVLVEFWHNHFNVNAYASSEAACTWAIYDRDVIRGNCLGNFRTMLESVAKSPAMLYYLDNFASKDGPANENYARELFELHTLGADSYLNNLYSKWREVPGALEGHPVGYIDQDVYETARALTGWSVADGDWIENGLRKPDTGEFMYISAWNDSAQKRVLGVDFDSNEPPLTHGRRVLDLVASHPGTARHLATKLCKRLVADNPPKDLIDRVAAVWLENVSAPDQIKKVVRAILLSPEFAATWGQKVKRPIEMVVSFLRATDAEFHPKDGNLFWQMDGSGYHMFEWGPPTGHPDFAGYWLSTNVMLWRWNMLLSLFADWTHIADFNLRALHPANVTTSRQIVDFWLGRLIGRSVSTQTYTELLDFMRQARGPDLPPTGSDDDLTDRVNNLVSLIGMTPDFQMR